jgi:hypothetical protein
MQNSQKRIVCDCDECPFRYLDECGGSWCFEIDGTATLIKDIGNVLDDCPLKEGPITVELKKE